MNRATGDVASSSQDAQRQMQGQPRAAQQAQGAEPSAKMTDQNQPHGCAASPRRRAIVKDGRSRLLNASRWEVRRRKPAVRRDLSRLGQFERRCSRAWGAAYLSLHTRARLRRSAVNAMPAPTKMRASVALKLPGAMQLRHVPMIAGASDMAAISFATLHGPQTAQVNPLSLVGRDCPFFSRGKKAVTVLRSVTAFACTRNPFGQKRKSAGPGRLRDGGHRGKRILRAGRR